MVGEDEMIIDQVKQDLKNIVSSSEWATEVTKPDNSVVKVIFRESSNTADIFDDEISGTEIYVIGAADDLSDIKTDDVLIINTRNFKVVSKEISDFKVKLKLEEL